MEAMKRKRKSIIKKKFNPEDFKVHTECAICVCDFEDDGEVTPLPCNPQHFFHTTCLT